MTAKRLKSRSGGARREEFDTSKDRLLTSEVQELQARLQALERENHDLRQDLAKTTGVDPQQAALLQEGLQVAHIPLHCILIW